MVTLIIPHYNRAELLIQNIVDMDIDQYPIVDIIIVDDNSHHQQVVQIRHFIERYSSVIQLVENVKNVGPSKCRNIGLERANQEFVIFLDSDDRLNLKLLDHKRMAVSCDSFDGYILYKYIKLSDDTRCFSYDKFDLDNLKMFLKCGKNIDILPTSCLILRRDYLMNNNIKFPVMLRKSEDTYFKFKLLSFSPKLLEVPTIEYYFCWNDVIDSITRNLSFLSKVKNHLYTIFAMLLMYRLIIRNTKIGWLTPVPRAVRSIKSIMKMWLINLLYQK